MTSQPSIPTPDEIWSILREVSTSQKETGKQIKTLSAETGEQIKTLAAELSASQKETDRQMKETDRRLRKLDDLFTGQWGKLMEALVKGDLVELLNTRGIQVNGIAKEHERRWNGKQYEFDIIAINGDEVVVVEVKTTLKLKDLEKFTEKLKVFKQILPEYRDRTVYGAVAYLKANEGTEGNSENRGLFVIRATGSSASIINAKNFKPKAFA